MTPSGPPSVEGAVERLVVLAREAPPSVLSPQESTGLHRLELALLVGKRRQRALKIASVVALATAALLFVVLRRDRALTYEVTNATVSEDGYVATAAGEAT